MPKYFLLLLLLSAVAPSITWACAGCESSLSSDWQEAEKKTYKLDLRFDLMNQNSLRSGTAKIDGAAASQIVNNGTRQDVPVYTKNNVLTLSGEYEMNKDWKFGVELPVVMRKHSALGTASDGSTAGAGGGQYDSSTTGLGDAKLIARYLGLTQIHHFGLIGGLKVPTGGHKQMGVSTDTANAAPVAIARDLQLGTGTVDLILGVFDSVSFGKNWDYFSEGKYQMALNQSQQYKSGDKFNLNLGIKYLAYSSFTPQVQLNTIYEQHDKGSAADITNSGATIVYVSPGVSVPVMENAQAYGFVQVPAYQKFTGVQLASKFVASLGATYAF